MIHELEEHKTLLIALIAGLVFAAVGIAVVQLGKTPAYNYNTAPSANTQQPNGAPTPNLEIAHGRLSLEPAAGRHIYALDELVALVIKGSSDGQEAVGFDAALKVNQNMLAFSQVTSKLPGFETFNNVNDQRVYIGGIKKLDTKSNFTFNSTPLAEVMFKPLSQGHVAVDFIFKPQDTTESNIVLSSSKDGLGDVQGTDIYIGGKSQLTTASTVVLPGTQIKVRLKNVTSASATVDFGLGSAIATRMFTWAVDAPASKNLEPIYGYIFQVEKGQGDTITIYYAVEK